MKGPVRSAIIAIITVAAVIVLGLAAWAWARGVTVVYFRRDVVAQGYAQVCLQQSTPQADAVGDAAYDCGKPHGLHVAVAGREAYAFVNRDEGSMVLVCRSGARKHVVWYGYFTVNLSAVGPMPVTCATPTEARGLP